MTRKMDREEQRHMCHIMHKSIDLMVFIKHIDGE